MLTEEEWAVMEPLLRSAFGDVRGFRKETASQLPALVMFEKITGMSETNVNAVWHHRSSMYGPDCPHCGKPLRTPRTHWCAYCGADGV